MDLSRSSNRSWLQDEVNEVLGHTGLRSHLIPQPAGDVTRRVAFGVLALVLVMGELVPFASSNQIGKFTVGWLVIGYALLALTGWLPAIFGSLYFVAALVAILAPRDTLMVEFAVIGVFAIVADWISRGWLLPAGLALVVTNVSDALCSDSRSITILGALLGISASVGVGLGLRWNGGRLARLREEAESAHRQAEAAQTEVRREIAATLHDTVVADLVRLLVTSQSLSDTASDSQAAEDARVLTDTARDAMVHLRALISTTLPAQSSRTESLIQVIVTCRTMLAGRSITLRSEVPSDVDASLTQRQCSVAALVVREAATNILKYGRSGSHAELAVEIPSAGGVALMVTNQIDPAHAQSRAALGGGFGLHNLTARVAREGGTVEYGARGASWILTVLVPPMPSGDTDQLPSSGRDPGSNREETP